jgi:ABC-2 type transport system permease protein
VFPGVEYTAFLIPGLVMMSVLQNSFANGSSSLMQSKMTGNIVFVLLPPLSHREFFAAYLLAAVGRGVVVAAACCSHCGSSVPLAQPLWASCSVLPAAR